MPFTLWEAPVLRNLGGCGSTGCDPLNHQRQGGTIAVIIGSTIHWVRSKEQKRGHCHLSPRPFPASGCGHRPLARGGQNRGKTPLSQ